MLQGSNAYANVSTDELNYFKEGRIVPRKGHIAKRDVLADPLYNDKGTDRLEFSLFLTYHKLT